MSPQKPRHEPAKIKDLPVRNASLVRGGTTMLSSAVSDVMKNFGGALQTAARG